MDFKVEFANLISDNLSLDITKEEILKNIEIPPNIELGDFSFTTFFLKNFGNPIEIAKILTSKLININSTIFEFSNVGGYVNVKIKHILLFKEIISKVILENENYGRNIFPQKEYVIDTFNTNPLKTLHIGHLRNIVTGDFIYRILCFSNQIAHPVYYGGDVGTHISKWYWYYSSLDLKSKKVPSKNVSKWFGEIYNAAGEKLSQNPELKKEVDAVQKEILINQDIQKEIEHLRDLCYEGYMSVKSDLDVTIEDHIFESQSQKEFFKLKDNLINSYKDIIYKSEGAIIADLNQFDLDVLVLIKENGAPLYGAKDIGLVKIKQEKFPNCSEFIYVVGSEQKHYFKQLFKLFSFIYPKTNHKHIAYGLVNVGSEKMSSRQGKMVLYEDFRDLLLTKVKSILSVNGLNDDEDIIKDITFGTIKFEMLKIGLNKNLNFNIDSALDLQGDSSVYLQYSGVRARSIIKKSNFKPNLDLISLNSNTILELDELKLLKIIGEFKGKCKVAFDTFKPSIISNYCLNLAHSFNKFYANCSVINSDQDIMNRRLLLTNAFLITLRNSLNLLGINIPKKM